MSDAMLRRINNKVLVALRGGETANGAFTELKRIAQTSQVPEHKAAAQAGVTRVIKAREAKAEREAAKRANRKR